MKTRYEIIETKASPFGGLYVISEFLHQIKFPNLFNTIFGKLRRHRYYQPVDNINLILASIVAGGERLYDIQRFSDDPVIGELFAIDRIPRDTTVRDDLLLIGQRDEERQELLFQLNELLFAKQNIRSITIDVDGTATPVDGHQESAEKGYCPAEPGRRCFQSLAAFCDETQTVISEQTRSGSTHCAHGIIDFMKPILDRLSPKLDQIMVRLDAGFYSHELLDLFESYPNVYYEIGVPQHQWLQTKIRSLCYKSYHHSHREYSSFAYGEGTDGGFRYYYVERTPRNDRQGDLFEDTAYTYRVIVSNAAHQPHVAFRYYNGRGRCEKSIEELKNQYALGKMVSGNFFVTKALYWLSYLTFTLIGMVRCVAFRTHMRRYRMRRLRFILFSTIGYYVTHARKTVYRLALSRVGHWQFKFIMQRIWAF